MDFRHDGFDVWAFRRTTKSPEYLLLKTSAEKARKWFGGGQFWQIPSDFIGDKGAVSAVETELSRFGLEASAIWAAEHAYTIYNRRYEDVVHISVFAAEVVDSTVTLGPEHAEYRWCSEDEALDLIGYKGLKDGLRSVVEFITRVERPLPELLLMTKSRAGSP